MTYTEKKERARCEAIHWQMNFQNKVYAYEELMFWGNYFERLGRRYGLLKEFRESGII